MITKSFAVLIALGLGAGAALAQTNPKLIAPAVSAEQAKTYVFDLKADQTKVVASVVKENTDTSRSLGTMPDLSNLKPSFNIQR